MRFDYNRSGEKPAAHATSGWVIVQYMRLIGEYLKTLEKYPNPKAVNLTEFGR